MPVYSDNFNRGSLGAAWTVIQGTFSISGSTELDIGNGTGVPAPGELATFDTPGTFADGAAEVKLVFNGDQCGPFMRYDSGTGKFYWAYINQAGSPAEILLYYWDGAAFHQLGVSGSITWVPGTTVAGIRCTGTTIECLVNGVSVLSVTDSSITAAGKCGMRRASIGGSDARFDDFVATVAAPQTVSGAGAVASAEAFGTPTVFLPPHIIAPAGIDSAESFGTPTMAEGPVFVQPVGIDSALAMGTPGVIQWDVVPPLTDGSEGLGSGGFGGTPLIVPSISLIPSREADPGFFRIKLTTLHYPGVAGLRHRVPAYALALIDDFQQASVTILLNDQREAAVTVDRSSDAAKFVRPFGTLLHVVYVTPNGAHLVFWGPVTTCPRSTDGLSVQINAVDRSLSLKKHFVRFGDRILNGSDDGDLPNPYNKPGIKHGVGYVPLDAVGIKYLIDCARNTDEQNARGVPDLGIEPAVDATVHLPTNTTHRMACKRGLQIWQGVTNIRDHLIAPDFEFVPWDQDFGIYALLNFYTLQGDPNSQVLFTSGFQDDNAVIQHKPGGDMTTHAHVLSDGDKKRITVANADSSADNGVYVDWISTKVAATDVDALEERGKQIIATKGRPPEYYDVKPNLDCELYYLEDFFMGDTVHVRIRDEDIVKEARCDIVKIVLATVDNAGNVGTSLDVQIPFGDAASGEEA